MRRLRFLLPVLAAVAVVAVAIPLAADDDDQAAPVADVAPGGEVPESATVPIENIKFVKQDVRVAVGGEVTWVNKDRADHTSTSSESATESGGLWDTGIIEFGQSESVTFDTAGTFDYLCTVHPFMKATVTVVDPGS